MNRGQWPNRSCLSWRLWDRPPGLVTCGGFLTWRMNTGGAAFVLAVIVANLLIGIPLLAAEVGLGSDAAKVSADAWKQMEEIGLKYLGWFTVTIGFFVLAYYMTVLPGVGLHWIFIYPGLGR